MLVWVVDIMWKPLLFYKLELLYNDNLIKCDTFLRNKNIFYFDDDIKFILLFTYIIIFFYYMFIVVIKKKFSSIKVLSLTQVF